MSKVNYNGYIMKGFSMPVCKKCNRELADSDFYMQSCGRPMVVCKACHYQRVREANKARRQKPLPADFPRKANLPAGFMRCSQPYCGRVLPKNETYWSRDKNKRWFRYCKRCIAVSQELIRAGKTFRYRGENLKTILACKDPSKVLNEITPSEDMIVEITDTGERIEMTADEYREKLAKECGYF
jgi:hypothetical protein